MKYFLTKFPALLLTLIVGLLASSNAFGSATIIIQNNDAANVGFNDPTPATPVGGNPGTTVGQQRLRAFEFAASIWGATLTSGPTIVIKASWSTTMDCTATTGTLGGAGAATIHRDFAGSLPGFWYSTALANALSNGDRNGATAEINAQFNANIGTSSCLANRHWYYGLDNAHGADFDLVSVLLHEFGHGLGFQSFTDPETGVQAGSTTKVPSIYDHFLLDTTTGKTWDQMTDAERVASAVNTNNLVWNGAQLVGEAGFLTNGKDSAGRLRLFTPSTVDEGSSVSHWDSSATPNQLMEPNISANLGHGVTASSTPPDLTFSLLKDIGWCSGCPQPPPPTPTPSPTPTPTVAPNNNFANAQTIGGCSGSVTGHNFAANKESGEPSHDPAGDPGGGSVWYQWTAPSSGSMNMTTAGSDYDTLLAVYTGSSVGGLTTVIKNDDVDPGNIRTSTVTFNAVAGTLYKIAVDGWDDERGLITLNWSESNCSAANPIDQAEFFVRQQYLDFLNREPDASGLAFWTGQITSCGSNQACIDDRRINASAAFFLSIEFQETGYLVYKLYKAAYGNLASPANAPVPVTFGEFLPDSQQISSGVIIGQPGAEAKLEQNKVAFTNVFVNRARFSSAYPTSQSPTTFVDALIGKAGFTPTAAQKAAYIAEFSGANNTADTAARARALRGIAENSIFHQQELNRAFVLMEYFGYLRRNPYDSPEPTLDFAGYNFWLTKLNNANGNYIAADMVKSFIISGEYRHRFGP